MLLADTAQAWQAALQPQGMSISDMFSGPIVPPPARRRSCSRRAEPADRPVADQLRHRRAFANRTGTGGGLTSKTATVIQNAVLSPTDANGGTANEQTPYGSTTYQATYKRPVFKNMTFVNCQIPVGMNALFQNCTFQGTTFVHMTTNITSPSGTTTTEQETTA